MAQVLYVVGVGITLNCAQQMAVRQHFAGVAREFGIAALFEAREALARLASTCADTTHGPCPILSAFERPERQDEGSALAARIES